MAVVVPFGKIPFCRPAICVTQAFSAVKDELRVCAITEIHAGLKDAPTYHARMLSKTVGRLVKADSIIVDPYW